MKLSGIYAITDEYLLPGEHLLSAVTEALSGGVTLVQYRSKHRDSRQRLVDAQALVELCSRFDVPLVINDDVSLCLRVGAAGVHLGQGDAEIASARATLGNSAIIGVSCHADIDLARKAQDQGADYVAFGRFFPSQTKPDAPPADLEILSRAKQQLTIPVVAIGGINAENGAAVIAAGADMLAVINYLFGGPGIGDRTRCLANLFETRIPD
ncbi:MAG: thiamine phosphate synthase [Pseudohongiellaceae bacterium]